MDSGGHGNPSAATRLELGSLSSMDTLQIVRELAYADAAQPSCQGEHARFQPSSQHVQAPGSRLCPERFGAWLFAETNGQPFYLNALLQMLLERGVLVPRLIEGSGWGRPHRSAGLSRARQRIARSYVSVV
jgi:hypothetical protein